ncbi:hypothetical protein WJX74_005046 [Apatococcus lobatus]|uniref:Protein kinase domain-containing protein n=1 Tax=Apatococcus lobatus TaxID=904363 RepID=A0AAW1RXQ9_9CHLO
MSSSSPAAGPSLPTYTLPFPGYLSRASLLPGRSATSAHGDVFTDSGSATTMPSGMHMSQPLVLAAAAAQHTPRRTTILMDRRLLSALQDAVEAFVAPDNDGPQQELRPTCTYLTSGSFGQVRFSITLPFFAEMHGDLECQLHDFTELSACMDVFEVDAVGPSALKGADIFLMQWEPQLSRHELDVSLVYKAYSPDLGLVAIKVQLRAHAEAEMEGHAAVRNSPHCLHLLAYSDRDETEADAAQRLGVHPAELMSLFMPLCRHGALSDVMLRTKGRKVPLGILKAWTVQMLAGLADLQDCQRVHGDLKPDNWLVESGGSLKLADFGGLQACREVGQREKKSANRFITPEFCPPELFGGRQMEGWEDDAWAAGCTLAEIILQEGLFERDPQTGVYSQTRDGNNGRIRHALDALTELYPEATDDDLDTMQAAMNSLMQINPELRVGGCHGLSFRCCEESLRAAGWTEMIDGTEWREYIARCSAPLPVIRLTQTPASCPANDVQHHPIRQPSAVAPSMDQPDSPKMAATCGQWAPKPRVTHSADGPQSLSNDLIAEADLSDINEPLPESLTVCPASRSATASRSQRNLQAFSDRGAEARSRGGVADNLDTSCDQQKKQTL